MTFMIRICLFGNQRQINTNCWDLWLEPRWHPCAT